MEQKNCGEQYFLWEHKNEEDFDGTKIGDWRRLDGIIRNPRLIKKKHFL